MGDISDMMLDGTLCQGCGCFIGDPVAYPRNCSICKKEMKRDAHKATMERHQKIKKVPCPMCGRKVKVVGMADHQRDAHGGKP